MQLKNVCNPDVVFCARKTTALAAARTMRHRHVGALVVVDDPDGAQAPLGVITDRDIVVEIIGNGLDAAHTTVDSVLKTPVVLAHEDEDCADVLERMRVHGVRRMPVVSAHQRLVGIVTLDDLLAALAADLRSIVDIVSREQNAEHRNRR